jgi:hypothetical protein
MAATKQSKATELWSDEERAAAQETARERRRQSRRKPENARAEGEAEVQAKIAEMPAADRAMAERIHALVLRTAPDLVPRTWYGMPAYTKDGKIVCFFQSADKFKARYATIGFDQAAQLDEGSMWPTSWALTRLTAADEKKIAALVKKAAG